MRKPPCYGCMDRSERCHSTCEKYILWRRDKDRENALRALEIQTRRDADCLRAEGIKNVTRGNRE